MANPATKELQPDPTEQQTPATAAPRVTSVANPRRIRLTRLTEVSSRTT